MKKAIFSILAIGTLVVLSSCDGKKCIRCTEIGGTGEKTFCSTSIEDRNDFQVEWIHQGYNCEEYQK